LSGDDQGVIETGHDSEELDSTATCKRVVMVEPKIGDKMLRRVSFYKGKQYTKLTGTVDSFSSSGGYWVRGDDKKLYHVSAWALGTGFWVVLGGYMPPPPPPSA
jgi:hypothetical protein